jgi:hypothetical protein
MLNYLNGEHCTNGIAFKEDASNNQYEIGIGEQLADQEYGYKFLFLGQSYTSMVWAICMAAQSMF